MGNRIVAWAARGVLGLIGVINLVRGLAHLLTEDSAAAEAGISIAHSGGPDIVYLFAIVGGVQAVLALFYLYSAIWDGRIVPLALVMEAAKTGLNLWVGFVFKPSQAEIVVGSRQDTLQLGLAVVGLVLSAWVAWQARRQAEARSMQ